MATIVDKEKLVEIYVNCDDFVKEFLVIFQQHHLQNKPVLSKRTRTPVLSPSEIMTILIFYHLSGFKNFQYYYTELVCKRLRKDFPILVSYERFVALTPRVMPLLLAYMHLARMGKETGIYYADSKKLPVCDNRRINQNKVFRGYADRGKNLTSLSNLAAMWFKLSFAPSGVVSILCQPYRDSSGRG